MPPRKDVFISYSHQDKSWLERLCVHLRPLEKKHKVVIWSDTRIKPGVRWQDEVTAALALTKVAVLLVSADFLSSEFITNDELPALLQAAEEEGTTILPLIVSPCGFLRTESLRQFQSVNDPIQPLIKLSKGDQEEVLEELASCIEELLTLQAPSPLPISREMKPPAPFWPILQKQLQQHLDPEEFAIWFRPLQIVNEDEHRLVLVAPNHRILNALERYRPLLEEIIARMREPGFEVLFSLAEPIIPIDDSLAPSRFNPKYLFESFVEGKSNELALAAAKRVAESPSLSYNPLFVYGGVGLGKTHLLHAIGQELQNNRSQLRVLCLAAEQFTNELIHSIRFDRMTAFRERYRTVDVLIIDDVHFLANKERTQEEFFHLFNKLYENQKQIILSSNSSPRNIPTLEERLRSRFECGLIVDIQPPDQETKMAIIHRKAALEGVEFPPELAQVIANMVRSNVREMEGLFNRVLAFSSLTGKPLSVDLALETLGDILPEKGLKPPAADIIRDVARHFGLKVSEIKGKSNGRDVVFPRQVAMYLCRRLTGLSYLEIARLFADRHRSTAIYAVDKIQELRSADPKLDLTLSNLERHFS
jgi:chromosomal replication initiator protein